MNIFCPEDDLPIEKEIPGGMAGPTMEEEQMLSAVEAHSCPYVPDVTALCF